MKQAIATPASQPIKPLKIQRAAWIASAVAVPFAPFFAMSVIITPAAVRTIPNIAAAKPIPSVSVTP